jgi:hypothetical protein
MESVSQSRPCQKQITTSERSLARHPYCRMRSSTVAVCSKLLT